MLIKKFGISTGRFASNPTSSANVHSREQRHVRTLNVDKLRKSESSQDTEPHKEVAREIWEDYSRFDKRSKRKKEYSKGTGDRMVPVPRTQKSSTSSNSLIFAKDTQTVETHNTQDIPKPRDDYEALELRLGVTFSDITLLKRALTHRSALSLHERADYERLEFLGDAVFDLVVAHLLSDAHPNAREGELSKMRAALVNTQALAKVARRLELGPYIRLGRGEYASGGSDRASILADVLEAIVGALYRDRGYDVSLTTVSQIFEDDLSSVTPHDPKTELQEVLHIAGSEPPTYMLELVEGPEHAPVFVTVAMVDGEVGGRGKGMTKKGAQQEAASVALARMRASCREIELLDGQKEFITEAFLTATMPGLIVGINGSVSVKGVVD